MALEPRSDTEIYSAKNRDKKTCQMAKKDKGICHFARKEKKFKCRRRKPDKNYEEEILPHGQKCLSRPENKFLSSC